MKFIRYRDKQENRLGYLQAGFVVDIDASLKHFGYADNIIDSILESPLEIVVLDPTLFPILQEMTEKSLLVLDQVDFVQPMENITFLSPVTNPGKVLCVGLNYYPPQDSDDFTLPEYPILFHKVASSLTSHNQPIIIPKLSHAVDYEGELAVVIGKRARQIELESALEYIAGYTIANDVGARDIQARASQWTSGKMFDTFCPLGPTLITADEVPDPDNLCITTHLNEEVVQDSSTEKMIFSPAFLVSYISELTTLLPGDIILTGSPKNRGDQPDPRILLKPGDTIKVAIEHLGVLSNPIMAEE